MPSLKARVAGFELLFWKFRRMPVVAQRLPDRLVLDAVVVSALVALADEADVFRPRNSKDVATPLEDQVRLVK